MSATRIWSKFKELLDVSWGSVSDGYLLKRSGTNIIGVPVSDVGQTWRGEYNPATTYQPNDAVSYSGSSYRCGATTTGVAPVPSTASYLIPPLATTGSMGSIAALPASNQAQYFARGDNVWSDLAAAVKPTIWSVRQRNYNALGNPNFEVDQRNCGTATTPTTGGFLVDRWSEAYVGTLRASGQQVAANVAVPGSNFYATNSILRMTLTTAQGSLGAGDFLGISQTVEGQRLRELLGDVHSAQLLVRSSVANLKFSLALRNGSTRSLCKLCTLGAANTWTLVQLPNMPVWDAGGAWSVAQGTSGYMLGIYLAVGTTNTAPAADVWQTGNYFGAPGMSNFASNATSSTFDVAFVQHEPGSECSMLIDTTWEDNYYGCLRYYQKTYDYSALPGSVNINGYWVVNVTAAAGIVGPFQYVKTMAKAPSIAAYSPPTAAGSAVRDLNAGVDRTIGAAQLTPNASRFGGWQLATTNAAATYYGVHCTMDTSW